MKTTLKTVLALIGLIAFSCAASAERRLAFVVGINDYQFIPKLEKAVGDANAMTEKLASLGFEVTPVLNPTQRDLNIAIGEFTAKLTQGDLVFIHFSGHGVEIDGDNVLLPVDVPKPKSGQKFTVKYAGIGLSRLIDQISSTGASARVFVIDACRDNPFEQAGVRSVGAARGLGRIEAPHGTFVLYSAGYRQIALDRLAPDDPEPTSVFTRVLLKGLSEPGKPISQIAREVRNQVQVLAKSSGHTQRPAYYDELSRGLVLNRAWPATVSSTPAQPKLTPEQNTAIELEYWNSVKTAPTIGAMKAYLKAYPAGRFAPLARIRIREMEKAKPAQQDETQVAAVASQSPSSTSDGSRVIQPVAEPLSKRELTLQIQQHLTRLGCNPGRPDGTWGRKSRTALKRFAQHADVKLASLNPSPSMLEAVSTRKTRICPVVCGRGEVLRGGRCLAKACRKGQKLSKSGRCKKIKRNARANTRAVPKKLRERKPKKQTRGRVRAGTAGWCPAGQKWHHFYGVCRSK